MKNVNKRIRTFIYSLMFVGFVFGIHVTYADEILKDKNSTNQVVDKQEYKQHISYLDTKQEDCTLIMGQAEMTKGQAFTYLKHRNHNKDTRYIYNFVNYVWEEGQREGVRPDIAFALMMKETGFLNFGGDVSETQNNFGGIGATGGGAKGNSFPSIQIGIRAVVQHLKAYGGKEKLVNDVVDPRFEKVTRGVAPYVELLANKWAVGNPNYGRQIVAMVEKGKELSDESPKSIVEDFKILDGNLDVTKEKLLRGKTYTLMAESKSEENTLYQFWLKDRRTNKWILLRDYDTKNTITWVAPMDNCDYLIGVHVKGQYSMKNLDDFYYEYIQVIKGIAKVKGLSIYDGTTVISNRKLKKGKTYTVKAEVEKNCIPMYQFWLKDKRTNKWMMLKDYGENNTIVWTSPLEGKDYLLGVHVKDKYSDKRLDSYKYEGIQLVSQSPQNTILNSFEVYDRNSIITNNLFNKGKAYTIKVKAFSATKPLYQFWLKDKRTNKWTILRDYSESDMFSWISPGDGENYLLGVHVKDKYSDKRLDLYQYKSIKVIGESIITNVKNFKIYQNSSEITDGRLKQGEQYNLKACAIATSKPLYQFWIKDKRNGKWTMLKDYSEKDTITWMSPNEGKDYLLGVHVKDKYSIKRLDTFKYVPITILGGINTKKAKIVLDAGHGNKNITYGVIDSGCIGVGGVRECDLTQMLTMKVGQYLKERNFDVIYTRDYLKGYKEVKNDLQQRCDIANYNKADLFVSFHFDSIGNPKVEGVSTHYSSYRPNLDNSGLQTINDIIYDKTPCIQAIKSKELSDIICKRLSELGFKNRGSKDHNLYLTRNSNMISLLIECGFITNPSEVKKVENPIIQTKMAEKIGEAISDFLK